MSYRFETNLLTFKDPVEYNKTIKEFWMEGVTIRSNILHNSEGTTYEIRWTNCIKNS